MFQRLASGLVLGLLTVGFASPALAQSATTQLRYLQQPDLQKELKLTAEQIQKLGEAQQQYDSARGSRTEPTPRTPLRDRSEAARAAIAATLSPEQSQRFQQILRQQQVRGGQADLFRDREFIAGLSLTPEQAAQIQSILDEDTKQSEATRDAARQLTRDRSQPADSERQQRFSAFTAQVAERRKTTDAKLQAALTADQQARFKELLGTPFEGQLSRGFVQTTERGTTVPPGSGGFSVKVGSIAGPAIRFLRDEQFRAELKLTPEQIQQAAGLPDSASSDPTRLEKIFTPEQLKRARELTLQYARQTSGPIGLFRYRFAVEALGLKEEQQTKLQTVLDDTRAQYLSLGRWTANETSPRRAELDRQTGERIAAILGPEQQEKQRSLVGEPFAGRLDPPPFGSPTSRASARIGASVAPATRFLKDTRFHDELKLTPEQIKQADELPAFGTVEPTRLSAIFTPEQLKRARELTLQNARQTSGTAGPFYFRVVVDELKPTDDQQTKIQALIEEDQRRRFSSRGAAAPASDPLKTSEEQLNAILTAEQQAKLKEMLGTPFQGDFGSAFGSRTTTPTGSFVQVGRIEMTSTRFLRVQQFHAELKLTPEQVQQAIQLPVRGTVEAARLEQTLTAEQLQRARELTLQYIRQLYGPAGPFVYRSVVESLALNEEQKKNLQTVLDETWSQYSRGSSRPTDDATKPTILDRQTEERIAAILTAEQQAQLKSLIGPAYTGDLRAWSSPSRSRTNVAPPATPSPKAQE